MLLTLCLILVLAACSSSSPSPSDSPSPSNGNETEPGASSGSENANEDVTISYAFWGDAGTRDLHVSVTEAFNAEHPNITVNPIHITSFDEYIQRIQTGFAGGNPPDVINFVHNDIHTFANMGVLYPLTEWVEQEWENENLDDNFERLMEGMVVDGEYYALPRNASGWYLYYNKDSFDEAGVPYPDETWDWERFVEEGKKLTNESSNINERTWAIALNAASSSHHLNFVWQAGGDYFNEDGSEFLLGTDESRTGLEYLHDLMYEYKIMADPTITSTTDARELFMSGNVAMYMDAGAHIARFQELEGFEWDIALLPEGPAGNRLGRVGPTGLVIPEASKHKEAAWEFIKFVNGPVGQEMLIANGFSAPVRDSILQDETKFLPPEEFKVNREVALVGYQEHGKLLPTHKNWTQINNIVQSYLELYYLNEMDLDSALAQIEQEVTPLLN